MQQQPHRHRSLSLAVLLILLGITHVTFSVLRRGSKSYITNILVKRNLSKLIELHFNHILNCVSLKHSLLTKKTEYRINKAMQYVFAFSLKMG